MIRITVFTPLYNRAPLLEDLYKSLLKQNYHSFEWLIVDDGSTDNAEQIIRTFIADSAHTFPIGYIQKENGGKHTAINRGVEEANGELFLILDSDDTLPADSLATIAQYYEQCKGYKDCAGVCGLMAHHDGQLIGSG